ncbi:adenylyl-sulfate kinase [bacterium]|nr:adenylyl-sulfate kinase [bacterium]
MAEQMNIVIAGHVDHGKSTVIGRLLADTNSLPEGKLQQVRDLCARTARPFEYAFLIDALKDEMAQGITIDSARVFFRTDKRDYIIIDAPGHIEFLKNMVTGASRAEAALLVIDAEEGVRENSRRHGYMLSMLGISQIAVLVNKMDLVDYDETRFHDIATEYTNFLKEIDVTPVCFIPISGLAGDNVATASARMPWHTGATVLDYLDQFRKEPRPREKPLRMPVQDVYKFSQDGDKRRCVAGTIETGYLRLGDELVFYPSGKRSRVQTIETFNTEPPEELPSGYVAAVTLEEQIYVTRGEIAARADQDPPRVTSRLRVSLFWMGREPMVQGKEYVIKVGTAKVPCELHEIIRVIDASNLDTSDQKTQIERHDVAECVFTLKRAIAFDLADEIAATSRFVIVDNYEIRGGGIIREGLDDPQDWLRSHIQMRNYKWETSRISREQRAEKYNQRPTLLILTGHRHAGKKSLAKALESRLFADGKIVYFLGIGNILYGVDADIKVPGETGNHVEHLRRLAEVANLLLDAGIILILTAIDLTQADLDIIETTIGPDRALPVWLGDDDTTNVPYVLWIENPTDHDHAVPALKSLLQERGIIYRP